MIHKEKIICLPVNIVNIFILHQCAGIYSPASDGVSREKESCRKMQEADAEG